MSRQRGIVFLPMLIVILLLGVAGYFAYQYFQPKNQQPNQDQVSPTPISKLPTPITDPTVGWQVYTNKEYGFELKYPSDYFYQENYTTRGYGTNLIKEFNVILSRIDNKGKGQISYIAIEVLRGNKEELSLVNLFKSIHQNVDSYNEVKFFELDAIRYNSLNENATSPQDFQKGVFFEKDGFYWDILVVRNSSEKQITEETFDQILSTFKFTDNVEESSYVNEQLGFSLKIPPSWNGLYKLQEKNSSVSFVYLGKTDNYYLLTISRATIPEFNNFNSEGILSSREIARTEKYVFWYSIGLDSPFEAGSDDSVQIQTLVRDTKTAFESFKLLEK